MQCIGFKELLTHEEKSAQFSFQSFAVSSVVERSNYSSESES